jgi:hypothetical protein
MQVAGNLRRHDAPVNCGVSATVLPAIGVAAMAMKTVKSTIVPWPELAEYSKP